MEKIKFKQLSGWLKLAVIVSWALFGFYVFMFVVGFTFGVVDTIMYG